jgi:O-antigen/teichoic acid export membrane protein
MYAWPLLPAGLSSLVVNWVDLVAIKAWRPAESVGHYAAAYQPVMILILLSNAFLAAALPLLVSLVRAKRYDEIRWTAARLAPQVAWGSAAAGASLFLAAEAIPLVLGKDYVAAIRPCQVLLAGMMFYFIGAFLLHMAKALDRVKSVFAVGLIMAAVNALLDVLLVPHVGIVGAAYATAGAFAVALLVVLGVVFRDRRVVGNLRRPLGRILLAGAPALGLILVAVTCDAAGARLLLGGLILLLSALAARLLGVFTPDTLVRLRKMHLPPWLQATATLFYGILGAPR